MFRGSMVALVTPMENDGAINFDCLGELVEWHIQEGTHGIVVLGTTGEAAALNREEKEKVMNVAINTAANRVPVIVGAYGNTPSQSIEIAEIALAQGADGLLIMTPAYVKPTQAGLFAHYKTIAEAVPLPIIVYNVPGRTACDILPETLERLCHISNIVAIKEATGSVERTKAILDLCGDRLDIYSGDDITAAQLFKSGAKGVISVTANVVPREMALLCEYYLNGNDKEADNINKTLEPLHQALFWESNPIPTKWSLHRMGRIPGGIRIPLTPLSDPHQPPLESILRQLGVI